MDFPGLVAQRLKIPGIEIRAGEQRRVAQPNLLGIGQLSRRRLLANNLSKIDDGFGS